ncbi:beige/BEACH domain-containing protein [Apiospora aurea]|uniref:Beige/BEACH domain-containing protein n=1 Tax=Apiospora aurea TaxID=335848 RepID=A0ABR1QRD7_9PEZI
MSTRPSRYRSSTSASTPSFVSKALEVQQKLLDSVAAVLSTQRDPYPDIQELVTWLDQIKQHLTAVKPPSSVQDDFRHLHGFQRLFDILRAYSGFYNPQKRSQDEKESLFRLLDAVLGVLSAAFNAHPGNMRYFRTRVESGGWEALEQSIASIGLGGGDLDCWTSSQLFGKLFAFALQIPTLGGFCQKTIFEDMPVMIGNDDLGEDAPKSEEGPDPEEQTALIQDAVRTVIGSATKLQYPEIIRTVVDFWISMPKGSESQSITVSLLVLRVITEVITASTHNLCLVHDTTVHSRLLAISFDKNAGLSRAEHKLVMDICRSLMSLGVKRLADAQALLMNSSPEASEHCLEMVQEHQDPPFIQFDLSLHGHASIDLPSLGRSFPPSSSNGYTFMAWIRVDEFDPKSHTTIFGVFDATQTCFLLLYLEKDTRNFILQTSVTSRRPSVRFKSFAFKEKRWYHIALVHRRKTMSANKAYLYVDGELVEHLQATFPSPPPLANGSTESFASFASSNNKTMPVQAFLGTPRELSSHLGAGIVSSKWSVATAHLFEEALSDDYLAVPSRLGPRYQGNFQDCLGAFQTYEASAHLGLRNDLVTPGKDGSDLIRVIRDKAGYVMPENRLLLSLMSSAIIRERDSFSDSQLFRSLSRGPSHALSQMTMKSGTGIAINTALPSINDALIRSSGVAVLSGEPVIAVPRHLDDAMWQLAGFTPLALKIVERASNAESLTRAVEMIFRCVNSSWRNSEAMERCNGYNIMGMLLKCKLGLAPTGAENITARLALDDVEKDRLSFQLLSLVLEFVGYDHKNSLNSIIKNPLAYRILLVDFDVWRRCVPIVQELYYKQFMTFARNSKYHEYNNRRLLRMRVVKRLLDALKAEPLAAAVLPFFMDALQELVQCSYNTEVHRSLALFITYAFHAAPGSLPRTPKPSSATVARPSGTPTRPVIETNKAGYVLNTTLNRKQVGVKILKMYSDLLCQKGNLNYIRRFAKTVTNKWLLYLLTENDPEVVVYGSKILSRLLVTHGSSYASKFSGKSGGFHIMAHRLKRWWDIPTIWPICFSILFGYDVAEIDFDKSFDFFSLLETFGQCKIAFPETLPIITSMLQIGLKDILRNQEDPASPRELGSPRGDTTTDSNVFKGRPRGRSMSLAEELETRQTPQPSQVKVAGNAAVLQTVIRFLADIHSRSMNFKDFALSSDYVKLLLAALYPVIVSTDAVRPEIELESRDSALTFEGGDVMIRPITGTSAPAPIVRTSKAIDSVLQAPNDTVRGSPLRKASSFVLLTSQRPPQLSPARLTHVMSPKKNTNSQNTSHAVLEGIMELVVNVFLDQLFYRKEFPGFGLFIKVPPGFQEHQAYFESHVLRGTILHLSNTIKLDWKLLIEPRVLTNMARFSLHMVEAIFEGWFMNGADSMLDFLGFLLEYLNRPDVSKLKSVRLCSQAVSTIRTSFLKCVLLKLSEMDDPQCADTEAISSLNKILYWQMVILDSLSVDDDYTKLLWFQFYVKLVDTREAVSLATVNLWRIMLVQKPEESSAIFQQFTSTEKSDLVLEFEKLTELDTESFVAWVTEHRASLDQLFVNGLSRTWEDFCANAAGSKPSDAMASGQPPSAESKGYTEGDNDGGASLQPKGEQTVAPDEDFEMVDDPNDPEPDEAFEDKNRRVMRRLETGDLVQQVYNISRIVGLEVCEGILLVGKNALYIMDNYFQSAEGEIVNIWEAAPEDRDPFVQIITNDKTDTKGFSSRRGAQGSRSWRWQDVISVSKRRFLFRDVAIEIFFTDGRSYLLTTINPAVRDDIHLKLVSKTPHTAGAATLPNPEDAWRLESLKIHEEPTQGLGAKFGGFFNSSPWNPSLRKWQRGEMSNFHYLMLVNTMAGRTFNDLTQYPVFPWILADYTSEELDLEDPATYRDLSKPMGAQTPSRRADAMERFNAAVEMEDQAPFHYGTHYSSAMVVASYLIRLPPFVQSHVTMQGGTFDHADRLFYSVERTWHSASRERGSDVRELIPEFFYLPDFLTNINGYDFGTRQGTGGKVNDVALPPWAKGDPKIFIAKHREALESPYVSQNLHSWIDLVFGYKQLGEAAVQNVNVFSPLSYRGAMDLDNAGADEREHATSVIYNFGQTPHQVFTKPHPGRENMKFPAKRLDTTSYALARIPHPLLESHERVASLIYSPKLDRLLCSSPFRLNLPPFFDKYLEWGYADHSIRFYFTENRKVAGVNENLHTGQISCIFVADSKTLVTAGEDCVVSVHSIQTAAGKPVELVNRSSLFGHKTPVTTIAASKAFSTLLTISMDGHAFLWDLNRLEFVRKLPNNRAVECARINDISGELMLCSGPNVALYTVNGELILDQNVCEEHDDFVQSCAFYEGSGSEWLESFLVFTGHKRGRVKIWQRTVKNGKWTLELIRRLDHADARSESRANTEAAITCITPMPQLVYTGDDDGRVYEWNLIHREK